MFGCVDIGHHHFEIDRVHAGAQPQWGKAYRYSMLASRYVCAESKLFTRFANSEQLLVPHVRKETKQAKSADRVIELERR